MLNLIDEKISNQTLEFKLLFESILNQLDFIKHNINKNQNNSEKENLNYEIKEENLSNNIDNSTSFDNNTKIKDKNIDMI